MTEVGSARMSRTNELEAEKAKDKAIFVGLQRLQLFTDTWDTNPNN